MGDRFHTVAHFLLGGATAATVTQNTTTTGVWIPVKRAEAFNFWGRQTSAGAAASVTYAVDISFWDPEHPTFDADTHLRTITVKAAETTDSTAISDGYYLHYDTPAELNYPFAWIRGKATENNVEDVTELHFVVGVSGS